MSNERVFKRKQILGSSVHDIFEFFADPYNLRQITPPNVNLEIVTPYPIHMREGAQIELKIRILGIPFRWVSQVTIWNPLKMEFQEEQIKGPFALWHHYHSCRSVGENLTELVDEVVYKPKWGFVGQLVAPFIQKRIRKMFDYRFQRLSELFRPIAFAPGDRRLGGNSGGHPRSQQRRNSNSNNNNRRRPRSSQGKRKTN